MSLLGVVGALLAVGLLIVVHELGHFLAAKRLGVRVERFAVGFGPALVRWRRGGTEYVLNAVPLGGYVKMAGEEPQEAGVGAPDEFFSQSPGRRALIIVAGVLMNALVALVCFVVAFQIGVKFPKAEVGRVVPGGPAEEAGLKPGDEIVGVGAWRDIDFHDLSQLIALSDPATGVDLTIRRAGREQRVRLRPRYSPALGSPVAGFDPAMSLTIKALLKGFPAERAGLRPGDRVVAVDGQTMRSWNHLYQTVQQSAGRELAVTVRRGDETLTFRVAPRPTCTYRLGARPRDGEPVLRAVVSLSPAERAGLVPGDRVVAVGGRRVSTWLELVGALREAPAGPLELTVERAGGRRSVTVKVPAETRQWHNRIGVLGLPPVVGEVEPGGPAEAAGLRPGMRVTPFVLSDGSLHPVSYWEELEVEADHLHGLPLRLRCEADGEVTEVTLRPTPGEPTGRYLIGIEPEPKMVVRKAGLLGAVRLGVKKSILTALSVYQFLRRLLFTRSISSGQLAGPLTIGYITYKAAAHADLSRLLYFLGVVGINLSLVNLLPIPILDGGHLMFIGLEKLKGSPVSPRALALAQYVGLALLIGLFLFVTYNDITRNLKFLLGG